MLMQEVRAAAPMMAQRRAPRVAHLPGSACLVALETVARQAALLEASAPLVGHQQAPSSSSPWEAVAASVADTYQGNRSVDPATDRVLAEQ